MSCVHDAGEEEERPTVTIFSSKQALFASYQLIRKPLKSVFLSNLNQFKLSCYFVCFSSNLNISIFYVLNYFYFKFIVLKYLLTSYLDYIYYCFDNIDSMSTCHLMKKTRAIFCKILNS